PGGPPGGFAIIGAGAVLAASTQGPVSAVVLMLELTRRLDTLMVPAILAIGVAVFVARMFEYRSIYSGRIHLGRSAAGRASGEREADGFIAVSSSARFPELLRALLRGTAKAEPVYVVNETGKLVGEVLPDCVREPPPETLPLETATAADFAFTVPPVLTSDDDKAARDKFATARNHALPLIDGETGVLVGVRRQPNGTAVR
ncbi:MAG TPA: chloride channel protein, partial [Acetobacteraceae bacterium]